jgi:hypothetical protein
MLGSENTNKGHEEPLTNSLLQGLYNVNVETIKLLKSYHQYFHPGNCTLFSSFIS